MEIWTVFLVHFALLACVSRIMSFDLALNLGDCENVSLDDLDVLSTQELVSSLVEGGNLSTSDLSSEKSDNSVASSGDSGTSDGGQRFLMPLSSSQFSESLKDRIPKSTTHTTKWAVSIWKEWRSWRNFREETRRDSHWPIPALEDGDVGVLDYWLARFITEIRRQDNQPYPAGKFSYIT